jgi:biotin transport system permease protein
MVKLLGLALALPILFATRSVVSVTVGVLLAAALAAVSGLGPRVIAHQLRPLWWVLLPLGALQVWWSGWLRAGTVLGTLVVAFVLAVLVGLTTREQDLLDAFTRVLRPARRLVDPERVALLLALTLRSIPVVATLAVQVQEARKARGAEHSVRAFAVPLVIRTIRYADRLGEALQARGVDD